MKACSHDHRILSYYYAKTKEMIYESVNLKGVVHETKFQPSVIKLIQLN